MAITLADSIIDDLAYYLSGTQLLSTNNLEIRTGSPPSSADAAATGILLVTVGPLSWLGVTSGTSVLDTTPEISGIAIADGTAGYGRLIDGYDGTTVNAQGYVGTSGTFSFVVNSVDILTDGTCSLLAASIIQPKAIEYI